MAVKVSTYQAKDYAKLLGMDGFSDNLLNNHFTLYQGYVNNTNKFLELINEAPKDGKDASFAEYNRRLGFEWNGMRLHECYFDALCGKGKFDSGSEIARQLTREFGSMDEWKKSFQAMGTIKGVGWVALYHDPNTGHCLNCWIEEHHISHPAGCHLLLVMDMWEHAFMLDYGLNKKNYIEAFFANLDWDVINDRFRSSVKCSGH
jgi:Fe-Mn family superoxide dismutase